LILAVALLIAAAGAPLDRGDFRYARPLGNVAPGLVSVLLDADALARSRELDDVRIVDAHDNQVPYVVEPRSMPIIVALPIPRRTREGSRSVYRFALPYETLPRAAKLELTTSARVFQRDVALRPDGRDVAWQAWTSADPEAAAPPLSLDGNTREIVIEDGDNAPLPITTARLFLPAFAVRFTAPGGPLTLLYGASIPPPHYDIALIAPRILSQPARKIVLEPAPVRVEGSGEKRVFWIAIAAAVAVLLAVLGRLLVRA
jgi:hypothetical protein